MKEIIDFKTVPYHYPMCLNRECTKADSCLRQIVEQNAPAEVQQWTIISPRYMAELKGDCPHYRSSQKVRFAKGFMNILENLPHKQMRQVISQLIGQFGQRTYYRIRKGERLLSPAEQRQVLSILKYNGANQSQEFDGYIEEYDW